MKKILFSALAAIALVACKESATTAPVSIIPEPVTVVEGTEAFVLRNGMTIGYSSEELKPAAEQLVSLVGKRGFTLSTVQGEGDINMAISPVKGNDEGYKLRVDPKKVTLDGTTPRGVLMGMQSFIQLIPYDKASAAIQTVEITDYPRLSWRGLMLDVSRQFLTVDEVKNMLDMMAYYKLNKLHWHLTDDQGWRVQIDRYPLLTEVGGWRKFNNHDRTCMRLRVEEDNADYEHPAEHLKINGADTLYGGFYTKDQIRDVVAYAAALGIDVIPEIDMPGHFTAGIMSYPELSCFGKADWGKMFSSPLCLGKDETLEFCKNVYAEIFELFPYEYVHLGADEVEKINWDKCPACQKRISSKTLGNTHGLQSWFVHEMEAFFNEKGKKLIGWDEIIEGGMSPTATMMWWRVAHPEALEKAVKAGNDVIVTPVKYCYFDWEEGRNSLKELYDYEPVQANMTAEESKHIIGIQGNLWAEKIASNNRLEYLAYPRILALSEIAWSQPEKKNYDRFTQKFIREAGYWDLLGINYRIPMLTGFDEMNAFIDTAVVDVKCILPNVTVRYTTDGSIPTAASTLYTEPLKITENCLLRFRSFRPDGSPCNIWNARYERQNYLPSIEGVNPTKNGLQCKWYDGNAGSANIEKGRFVKEFVADEIAVPNDMTGMAGYVFTGYFEVLADDIYTFAFCTDDGGMLYIDGELFMDNDGPHVPVEMVGQRALAKGLHSIKVYFYDQNNGGSLWLNTRNKAGEFVPMSGFKH